MPQPVFISYAHKTSRAQAVALHAELGGDVAYLDTESIRYGEPFPERLADALLDSRVVVVFAEPVYFTNWCCLLEWRLALTPYLRLAERAEATRREREEALSGIVVALAPGEVDPMLDRFPPALRERNWASAGETAAVAGLVRARLAENPPTLRERYRALGELDTVHPLVRETAVLPSPHRIGSIPHVPLLALPPSIRERFVGRADEIWRIHDVLTSASGGPAAASLTGAIEAGGGFGKTRLALEYLHRFGTRHFSGGLFWIDAGQDLEDQLYAAVTALNPSAPDVAVLRDAQGGVAGALARLVRARPDGAPKPLFVIDNVPEPPPGQPPLPLSHWCPVLGEAAVLATSRRRISLAGGDVVSIPIHPLDRDSAVRLLTGGSARGRLSPEDAGEVAEWVGNLPLALELLNGLLASGAMSGGELLRLSREGRPAAELDAAMEVLRGTVPEGTLRGITEAFAASYERLTEAEQLAARLIAWMAPGVVPEIVMEGLKTVFTPAVRATLRSRHFVTAPDPTAAQAYGAIFGTMHRLIADFLRFQSPDPEHEHSSVIAACERAAGTGTADERLQALHLSGPVIAALARNLVQGSKDEPEVFVRLQALARLLRDAGAHGWEQEIRDCLLSLRMRSLGETHPDTLTAIVNLAFTLWARGDLAGAEELEERVLLARCRTLGEEHPDTLSALNHLGVTVRMQGNFIRAQDLHERALSVQRRTLGEDHPATLVSMTNLAQALWARGHYAEAQELEEHVLSARRCSLGDEHPDTLRAMNNLAGTLRKRADLAKAQELEERVVSTTRRILGEDHPDTLTAMSNLSETLRERGDHAGAKVLQERVFSTRRRIYGNKHRDTSEVAWNLLCTLIQRGEDDAARAVLKDLVWLQDAEPETLSFDQLKIREWLPGWVRRLESSE
jgi:tetratricopeptide (TPR) repeat protein